MSWANVEFIGMLLAVLALWVWLDQPRREVWSARRAQRREERARKRLDAETRRVDLDALHRHYRTSARYYQATGRDPGELSPPTLPSRRRPPPSSSSQDPST